MGSYRPLYRFRVEHDYYVDHACRALKFRLTAEGTDLCRRRGILLRQTAVSEWTFLYDADGAGVDTATDKIEAELCITDPSFVLYTDWASLRPDSSYILELPVATNMIEATDCICEANDKRKIGSGFCSVRITMTERLFAAAQQGCPETVILHFHAPCCKWEYLLIPRRDMMLDPKLCLMEEQSGKVTFTPFTPVKVYGLEALRTVSRDTIPLKESYACKLTLYSLVQGYGRRQALLRYVPFPEPGKFLDVESGLLRQVCYL